jgi:hypothetical protein
MRYEGQVARSDCILGVFPMGAVHCAGGGETSMIRPCEIDGILGRYMSNDVTKSSEVDVMHACRCRCRREEEMRLWSGASGGFQPSRALRPLPNDERTTLLASRLPLRL